MAFSHRSTPSCDPTGPWSDGCAESLICPVCGGSLHVAGRTLRCGRGHAFDVAREGYVNLVAGRSTIHGDTAEMLRARRRFLEHGYFAPIADAVAAEIETYVSVHCDAEHAPRRPTVLDVGCGDGYYTGRLMDAASRELRRASFIGIDVSKDAARMAARRYPRGCFLVNDVRRITLADASVDAALDVFAPRHPSELARVIRPAGLLVVVVPRGAHLHELRARWPLLGIEPGKVERVTTKLGPFFRPVGRRAIEYGMDLPRGGVADLLTMTPGFHHHGAPSADEPGIGHLHVTAAVDLLRFERCG